MIIACAEREGRSRSALRSATMQQLGIQITDGSDLVVRYALSPSRDLPGASRAQLTALRKVFASLAMPGFAARAACVLASTD
jgi:hypothetical protein